MNGLRKWFTFSKGERMAVFTILACIGLLVVAIVLRPAYVSFDNHALHNLDSLIALRQAAMDEQQNRNALHEVPELHPFPFNPNTMTEEDGLRLGLTERQVRNIINYRDKGGKFFAKNDLAKLYSISELDFAQLEPYIVLPEISRKEFSKSKTETKEYRKVISSSKTVPTVDLNTVDSVTLVELPQIGGYTAARIVAYRESLGGFFNKEQLLEVKGMDKQRYDAVQRYVVIGEAEIRKIDINRADFKTLVNHPYLNYNQVKLIFNQREKRGMIKDWEQLKTVIEVANPTNPLLERYVKF